MSKGVYLVDLDGTLARYTGWHGVESIGEPIMPMVNRVRMWIKQGRDVRIFTARIFPLGIDPQELVGENAEQITFSIKQAKIAKEAIENYCLHHLGKILPIQCYKSFSVIEIWDDRAVQVIPNVGERADSFYINENKGEKYGKIEGNK